MSVYRIARGEGALPVYRQIREILESEVREIYQAGDYLPPESELATRFGVNRHTLRRAIEELIESGLVDRVHGRGTFVLEPPIEYAIGSGTRFTETLELQGKTTVSEVLRKQRVQAIGGVAKRLSLENGDDVIFIETLRKVNDKPFCIISHFLPMLGYQNVLDNYAGGSLHQYLKDFCDTRLRRSESLISAVMPEAEDANLLNMPRHMPVLRVKSLNLNAGTDNPVEYAVTRFRGDAAQLSVKT